MIKKNFKSNNPVLAFINTQNEDEAQNVQEVHEVPISHSTQGRKGKKLPRVNMAFSESNFEYLHLISRIEGVSLTEYVNRLIEKDMKSKNGIIEEAKNILKKAQM
jgi:predicted DNA binding CopG/RHH family protein